MGDGRVICALSGGVDSAVAATLIHRAIGDRLTCIFVNNGLLRLNEAEQALETFRDHLKMNVVYVDATDRFLDRSDGVVDPEQKRRSSAGSSSSVFEEEARKLGKVDFLAQGTLYPDVIESTSHDTKAAARIKTHHNVGGLAREDEFSLWSSRFATCSRTRSGRWASSWACPSRWCGASPSPARAGGAHHRRGHPRAAGDAAAGRRGRRRRGAARRAATARCGRASPS